MRFSACRPAGDHDAFERVYRMASSLLDNETDVIEAMGLCLKEMLSNIREHQYALDPTKLIYLQIEVTNREVIATIIDVGKVWRPDGYYIDPNAEAKMLKLAEELALRGRGHLIMSLLSHSLEYRNGGRVRILAWHRKGVSR